MADLKQAVAKFASDLADKVQSFATDISELEVRTYTTGPDNIKVLIDKDLGTLASEGKITLRAYSQIGFDGDTVICVPEENGVVDKQLWELHQSIVNQALTNRATMISAIGDAAASALKALQASE
ncbi:MAG: hypothetical protein JXA33_11080 [Anaerolineae bacterium]|nr:hypothetical protein [Anaerolineae bacterium]